MNLSMSCVRVRTASIFPRIMPTARGSFRGTEALQRKELRETLKRAIASLGEVLMLRDVQRLGIGEAAQILGITEGSVKTRLFRARLQLRDAPAPGIDGSWSTSRQECQKVRPG